jgi:hypothetical protein
MTTIYEIYEDRVKEFEDNFTNPNWEGKKVMAMVCTTNYTKDTPIFGGLDPMVLKHKQFLRQSFIAMVEGRIGVLKADIWSKENCPISKMEYELEGVDYLRAKIDGHNQAINDQISRLESELKQLKADLLPTNNKD